MIENLLKKLIGSKNDRELKRLWGKVQAINALEPQIQALTDEELKAQTPYLREKLAQGATLDALGAALFGEVTLADGRVTQANFDSYPMLRMAQAPHVDVHIIESGAPIGGVGETPVGPLAPALANAIFAASGQRLRRLPVIRNGFTLAS